VRPTPDGGTDDRAELVDGVRRGDVSAVARMLSLVEQRAPSLPAMLADLHRGDHRTDHSAHVVGVTGPPGGGKSTLVSRLAAAYSRGGRSVGIIAVDPSSAFSGGAILGDRIRMNELAGDDRIFIRSMATRGVLGGLARATLDAVTVLDASGKDVILLETVGVGQAEIDVVSAAHTVVVVSVPGLGDDVQMIKAGLLEIADVHVVNKSDRPGADRLFAQLRDLQRLSAPAVGGWTAPVLNTVASTGDGVNDLLGTLDRHLTWLTDQHERVRRERRNAGALIRWAAEELIRSVLTDQNVDFVQAVEDVAARRDDPYHAARRLIRMGHVEPVG
jgi:LAO/AO transport system kinase